MAQRHRIPVDIRHMVVAAVYAPTTKVVRYVEILEQDLTTVYRAKELVEVVEGSVSGDYERAERKALQLTLGNSDGFLEIRPTKLWYDKLIRVYYGVEFYNTDTSAWDEWSMAIGTFMIDELDYGHFPNTIVITGRDRTKKLANSKFRYSTTFAKNTPMEDVVKAIALSGGIPLAQMSIPFPTGVFLEKDMVFESGTSRWEALKAITVPNTWETRFLGDGIFILQEIFNWSESDEPRDTMSTGWLGTDERPTDEKNITQLRKKRRDTRIYNVIVVTAEAANNTVPISAIAENTAANSPTSVAEIGERVYFYKDANVATATQAQKVADRFLNILALEEYEAALDIVPIPWVEEGDMIALHHEDHKQYDTWGFIMANFTISLNLGPMQMSLRRLINQAPA